MGIVFFIMSFITVCVIVLMFLIFSFWKALLISICLYGLFCLTCFILTILFPNSSNKYFLKEAQKEEQRRKEKEQRCKEKEQRRKEEERIKKMLLKMRQRTLSEVIYSYNSHYSYYSLSEKDKGDLYSYVWSCLGKSNDGPVCEYKFSDTESLKQHLVEHKKLDPRFAISIVNSKCVYEKLDKNSSHNIYAGVLYCMP